MTARILVCIWKTSCGSILGGIGVMLNYSMPMIELVFTLKLIGQPHDSVCMFLIVKRIVFSSFTSSPTFSSIEINSTILKV